MTLHHADDDSVAQYVAGTLPAVKLDDFEQHLLTCVDCQAAVRTGAATRAALVATAAADTALKTPPRLRRVRLPWLAAAAAVALIVLATNRDSSIEGLGRVTPAPFVAGALRRSSEATTALVDSGMAAYAASDFSTAAERLDRASRGDSSAAVAFFLGVSLLMRGNDSAALNALERIAAESPYAEEATYYAAKALVRLERPDSAIAVLERRSSTGTMATTLQSFADSLRRRR